MTAVKIFFLLVLVHRSVEGLGVRDTMLSPLDDAIRTEERVVFENDDVKNSLKKLPSNLDNTTTVTRSATETNDPQNVQVVNMDEVLDIFNLNTLALFWNDDSHMDLDLTISCEMDFTRYMNGILKGVNWALKMVDSSGKRPWGVFTGNRYWIGDPHQCREMESTFLERQRSEGNTLPNVVPPFRVNMNSMLFELDILKTGIEQSFNVTLGLCLPATCDLEDVEKIFYHAEKRTRNDLLRMVRVENIRNLSTGYSIWDDSVFYILVVTFAVVTLFIILGTAYDVALRYKVLQRENAKRNVSEVITEMKILRPMGNFNGEITISKLWSVKVHNGSLDVCNQKDVPKPLSEALLSFSLLLNLSKVASLDVGNDTLAPIHGLRFFSMLWVIMVHTCLLVNEVSDNNMFRSTAEADFMYQTVSNGTYSVDTFFFMSGCLVTFLYFRTIAKERMREKKITKGCGGQILQFLGMMCYRYLRLTPPYLLTIGLIQVSMKWYHDHSAIELPALDYKNCDRFWWRNALYINTYFDMDDRCMVWSWYLANDTQFYTLGIIILIIGASFLRVSMFIAVFILIASWITTAIIALKIEHVPSIQDPFADYASLYDKPWSRVGPYLIGMAAGWYLFKVNCKVTMNKAAVAVGWTLTMIAMISIVYGLYGSMFGPVVSALYTALSHSGWAICIAWILIACVTGYAGFVNNLLSWKYIYPLSRLTYCAYLVHPAIHRAVLLRGESSLHPTQGLTATIFFGVIVASYAVALFLSLFFEAPMVSLLRIVHPLRRWKRE